MAKLHTEEKLDLVVSHCGGYYCHDKTSTDLEHLRIKIMGTFQDFLSTQYLMVYPGRRI